METARPEDTSAVAAATEDMETEVRRFFDCAVVLRLSRGHGEPEPEEVEKALRVQVGVQKGHVKVSRHRPENFLADFTYPHHWDAALGLERLPVGSREFRIWPWRILPYGDHCDMHHHVRLCLEAGTKPAGGLPGLQPPYGHDFHGARARPPYHHEEEEEGKEGVGGRRRGSQLSLTPFLASSLLGGDSTPRME
jgi:hypothetical protein